MHPTSMQERVELLDILRGVAIFGMFTVNTTADMMWSDQFSESTLSAADSITLVLVDLFTNGKFITIFSFLFGIGFFVQSERVMHRGGSVPAFWVRRLAGLLMIGLIAEACTLPARILVDYSIFGLGLLLLYRFSPRWIMAGALACFAAPKIYAAVLAFLTPAVDADGPAATTVLDVLHESVDGVFSAGSFVAVGSTNMVHTWEEFTSWQYYLGDLDLLGLMLIGLFVGRIGAVWDRDIQVAVAARAAPWLLLIGFCGGAIWVAIKQSGVGDESPASQQYIAGFLAWPVGMPLLGLGYAAGITLLVAHRRWKKLLLPFAPIGRMALTNYLFTAFVTAILSFQWGFGLYGQFYPAVGILIAIAVLPLQLLVSRWWLDCFSYGPAEWLWRAWTYGRWPPMRLAVA